MRIITPRNNQLDVLACETFLAALVADAPGQIALELCGTSLERLFIVRGDEVAVTTALQQLAHAYPQCDFEDLTPEQDPIQNASMLANPVRQAVELRLRDAVYLPLRTAVSREGRSTYDDYSRAADPMIGLISAMDGLRATESCVIQFALLPMPDDWSRFWRGTLDDVNVRARAAPQSMAASILTGLGLMGCLWGVIVIAFAITLKLSAWLWLLGILLGLAGVGFLYLRFKLPSPPDPDLVRKKIHQSAFRVCARIFVFGDDAQLATYRMDRIKGAFRGYNLAGGNGFIFVPALNDDPSQLLFEKKHSGRDCP
ncbi:MAG: hypothetical protein HC853_19220 [Anaerolineae bacterium]|nr:hypothetical protein [Anaerolineae bacterium]